MKNTSTKISILVALLFLLDSAAAQCGAQQTGGTATNMFTLIRNSNSSIAANKALNTIAFIHRNNASSFGGSSGNLRFDYSTNGGTTWTNDQGVLNPLNSSFSRYPNIAIYNPVANTNTLNAYISYMAPTINSVSSAWVGEVTGVSKLNVTGVTESYNQNGIGTTWQASSLVNGAPGVFWAIDLNNTGNGFVIYKGVWSSGSSDIVWSVNYAVTPTVFSLPLLTELDFNIAFDPTGQTGYFSFAGHANPGPSNLAYCPILYKTTDGGVTWTGPITVDLSQFSCISSNTVSPNVPGMNAGHDLVVDVNGNPHIITTLGNVSNYVFNYSLWHHMYDITLKSGLWAAYDLGNVNGNLYTFGVTPNFGTQWQAPQAARSNDGTKIFFTWTDNTSYSLGAGNSTPNLFGKAYNVTNDSWTPTKDFTSCNIATAGKILFPHIAPEVLEPNSTTFKIAAVYGEPSVTNDLGVIANFTFLDNITFVTTEFSLSVPPATVTIQQAPLIVICPNSTLIINIAGTGGQALWNTGATTTTLSITSGTATSYSVLAQVGCNVGSATIAVTNLTLNPSMLSSNVCPGNPANFTALGNALSYNWTPGNVTGTNVTLYPTTNMVTLTATGSNSCTTTQTVSVTLLTPPTINIAGTNTICAGIVLSLTASGAQTYVWDNSTTNTTFTDTPLVNTTYTVTGTAANTCTNSISVSVNVNPSPTVNINSTQTAICMGQTVGLNGTGAVSYSWNASPSPANITVTPAITTNYTLTGGAANLCENSKTITITVYALPAMTITPTKTIFCKGEKTKLTASGASTYTWVVPGVISPTVQVNPTVNTTYTIIGASNDNCVNTKTFALVVSPCVGMSEQGQDVTLLTIYPNPNNGSFIVKGFAGRSLTIVNELGQVVKNIAFNGNDAYEVNAQELSNGLYFIIGSDGDLQIRQKLVITR